MLNLPGEIHPDQLRVLYDEAQASIDMQLATVESCNARAGAIIALAVVVLTVVAAIDPTDQPRLLKVLILVTTSVFVLSAVPALLAWRQRSYRTDPDMTIANVEKLARLSPRRMQAQVLVNRLQSIATNKTVLDRKRVWLRWASALVGVGLALIVAMIFARLFAGSGVRAGVSCSERWQTPTTRQKHLSHSRLMLPTRNRPNRHPARGARSPSHCA